MWKFADNGPEDAGSIGGDIQRGAAWSRRLIWSDEDGRPIPAQTSVFDGFTPLYAVIDDTWYAVDVKANDERDDDEPIIYDIQNQCWTCLCTDVEDSGGTEVASDYDYDYVNYLAIDTLERADEEAKRYAANARDDVYGNPENW